MSVKITNRNTSHFLLFIIYGFLALTSCKYTYIDYEDEEFKNSEEDAGNEDKEFNHPEEDSAITLINTVNLTKYVPMPVMGDVPVTSFSAENYTGTVIWRETGAEYENADTPIGIFQPNKSYTSAVTLTSSSGNIFRASVHVIHEWVDTVPAPFTGVSESCASVSGTVTFPPYIPISGAFADHEDSVIDSIRAAKQDGIHSLTLELRPGTDTVSVDATTDFGAEGLILDSENSPAEVLIDGRGRIIQLAGIGGVSVITVNSGVKLTLRNITFEGMANNAAPLIRVNGIGAEFIIEDGVVIKGNESGSIGGGVHIRGGTFNMEGGIISGNRTGGYGGGGVYIETGAFNMEGGVISGNESGSIGGGVLIDEQGAFNMEGGAISGNKARFAGGGVCTVGGIFIMKNGTISGNESGSENGGVHIYDGTFTMEDGIISGNKTIDYGGGVGVAGHGIFTMKSGTISGNESIDNGGGVHIRGGTFNMEGGIISDNKTGGYGGGVYVMKSDFFTNSSTFTKTGESIIYGSDHVNANIDGDNGSYAVYVVNGGKKRNLTAGKWVDLNSDTAVNWD